jgi:2-methylcitrate dehydratase PrpD
MHKNRNQLSMLLAHPTDPTGQFASWLAGLTTAQVPQQVRERTELLMLDGLACALVGARLPWSATAVDAILRLEGCGTNPIIGWNRGATAPAAAMLNSSFIQGFELDDFHPVAPIHGASIVFPSLLACASQIGMASIFCWELWRVSRWAHVSG